jgi:putative FmdB family regulatory protein
MPTYEYRCQSCGDQFEIVQSFSDASLKVCAKCAGELRKVYGNVGISFKGSGFYKNDARTGSSSKETSSSGPASGSSETSTTPSSSGASESSAAKPAAESSSGSTGASHATPAASPAT